MVNHSESKIIQMSIPWYPCRSLSRFMHHAMVKHSSKPENPYDGYIYIPRCSMYGIFTYIWVIFRVNVGKYSIHGAYGIYIFEWIPMKMDWWPASSPVWVIESILLDHGSHGTGMSVGISNKYQFNWEKLVLNHRSPSFWYNYSILYIIIIIITIIINYHIGI